MTSRHGVLFGILGAAWLLSACAGPLQPFFDNQHFKRESATQGCPPATARKIAEFRSKIGQIQPGLTPVKKLSLLGPPLRTMVLARGGQEDLTVNFYQFGLASCTWMADSPNYLPIIMQSQPKGVVLGMGLETLMTLHAQGWELGTRSRAMPAWLGLGRAGTFTPTPWPWQSYDYSYLPRR